MKLAELIKQGTFASHTQEAVLNVIVTSSWLLNELSAQMAPYGLTPAQYNVLRILRGSHPDLLTCSAVGERLLDRTPDVTRLLNRLQRAKLVTRERAEHDRRVVHVGITEEGIRLVEQVEQPVDEALRSIARHLTEDELRQLSDLLERLRLDQQV